MFRNQGTEMRLVSLTIFPNNLLVEFLSFVPVTLGFMNFKVLERMASTREHNHGFDKLDAS